MNKPMDKAMDQPHHGHPVSGKDIEITIPKAAATGAGSSAPPVPGTTQPTPQAGMQNQDVAKEATPGSALQAYDFGSEAGGGMENIERDEIKIPFLIILQTNSPQVDPNGPAYIPGAQAGMIYNTSSGALYNGRTGIPFVPAKRDYNFIEYISRDAGGGLVAIYDKHDPNIEKLRAGQGKFGKLKTNGGNEIVQTMYIYGVFAPEGGSEFPAIIPFKSTQIGKYQRFVDRMNNEKYLQPDGTSKSAALWMHRWRLTTVSEQNKKGKFQGWQLRLDTLKPDGSEENIRNCILKGNDPLRLQAKAFNTSIDTGAAKADYSKADMKNEDSDVPF